MAVETYLGNPPENIRQWIIIHIQPAGHAETRFTLEGGTVETYNITGTLDQQWMIDNGYFDENNYEWIKTITQVDIGSTVTEIANYVFSRCSGLTSVTIGNSVTSIMDFAFMGCGSLMSVTIPNGVTSIEWGAFSDCIGLISVTIGNGVQSIGGSAFSSCSRLTSLTFQGKILTQVQTMENYPWGIEDTSIIHVE